jgi:hypothetical protein
MPDLEHTLQGHDLGFLKIVAEAWGVDLTAPDAPTALPILLEAILNRQTVIEMVESLPESAQKALAKCPGRSSPGALGMYVSSEQPNGIENAPI